MLCFGCHRFTAKNYCLTDLASFYLQKMNFTGFLCLAVINDKLEPLIMCLPFICSDCVTADAGRSPNTRLRGEHERKKERDREAATHTHTYTLQKAIISVIVLFMDIFPFWWVNYIWHMESDLYYCAKANGGVDGFCCARWKLDMEAACCLFLLPICLCTLFCRKTKERSRRRRQPHWSKEVVCSAVNAGGKLQSQYCKHQGISTLSNIEVNKNPQNRSQFFV